MPRIVILTTEPVPVGGHAATGAGLRAWGLARGLREAGIDARVLTPEQPTAPSRVAAIDQSRAHVDLGQLAEPPEWVHQFRRVPGADPNGSPLRAALRELHPDAIVLQHWGIAREVGELDCPLAIDLAGPHLLERRLWGSPDAEADLREKLDALRRADFLTCSGRLQRLYFLPYLALAGWDATTADALPVIPFSMQPARPAAPPRADRLIYGGFFLPWQDPTAALETALAALDAAGRGELVFVGGPHPAVDVSRGRFEPLLRKLEAHPRVRLLPPMSFDAYAGLLGEGGVALDLMARNAERELAFTTRTVVYLAAGLPVIHDDYSELGGIIARAGAGWAMAPEDRDGLLDLLMRLLRGELDVAPQAAAAHALVGRELDWSRTIGPLAAWCRNPTHREAGLATRLAFEEQSGRLTRAEESARAAQSRLDTLLGKRWVRWGLALTSGHRWFRYPAAALALLLAIGLLPIFLLNDLLAGRGAGRST